MQFQAQMSPAERASRPQSVLPGFTILHDTEVFVWILQHQNVGEPMQDLGIGRRESLALLGPVA